MKIFLFFISTLFTLATTNTTEYTINKMRVENILIMSNEMTIVDESGNAFIWECESFDEFEIGQTINVLMDNNNTTEKEDDEIVTIFEEVIQ